MSQGDEKGKKPQTLITSIIEHRVRDETHKTE